MSLPCPACGFLTVDEEAYGTYTICEVCGWEDDQVQLANPCSGGGANSESLYEAQLIALANMPVEIREHAGIRRSMDWRPLTREEIRKYSDQAKEKHWANKGVLYEDEVYWQHES